MLFATVRQRKIYVKAPQTVVKDGVNVDVLKLEMDDEWAEMTSIICVFSNGSVKKEVMHTFGQPITVPWECLKSTGVLMLGITGYVGTQKVMTTMNADNGWEIVQNSETTGDEQFEATPTLTQQLLEAATSANNAAEAANTAKQDILDAVSNGEFDGAPGKDGTDGLPGADGYSPSAKVTQTASGAEITITDKDGTTTATVMNGKDGADGVGIESVVQTTTSTEDGGTNVVTVTKTDGSSSTFTVKNGSKGSDGSCGTNDHSKLSNRDAADQHPIGAITGLEAALANIPPTDAFIVTLTQDEGGTYSVDKTFAEITAAIQSNRTMYLYYGEERAYIPFLFNQSGISAIFAYIYINSNGAMMEAIQIFYDGSVHVTNQELKAIPNPNALTFTGAVTGSYDGSAPLSVEIPSGGGSGGSAALHLLAEGTLTEDAASIDVDGFSADRIAFAVAPYGSTANSGNVNGLFTFGFSDDSSINININMVFVDNTAVKSWNKHIFYATVNGNVLDILATRDTGKWNTDIDIKILSNFAGSLIRRVILPKTVKITSLSIGLASTGVIGANTQFKVVCA